MIAARPDEDPTLEAAFGVENIVREWAEPKSPVTIPRDYTVPVDTKARMIDMFVHSVVVGSPL